MKNYYTALMRSSRPHHVPVLTPDGGVILCTSEADAQRVAALLNEAIELLKDSDSEIDRCDLNVHTDQQIRTNADFFNRYNID